MSEARVLLTQLVEGGEAALERLIVQRATEELFLEFKRSADQGRGARLQDEDRENFCKAVSGFGNSAGGLIVWGVDCPSARAGREEGAGQRFPLANAARFKASLDSLVGGATVPPHNGVENHVFAVDSAGIGFVATYVPVANNPPLHVVRKGVYYMRAGSAFVQIPHAVLSAMFGRRPTPQLAVRAVKFSMPPASPKPSIDLGYNVAASIEVTNEGLGIARDLYATIRIVSWPDEDGIPHISSPEDSRMESMRTATNGATVVAHAGGRFPPGDAVKVFRLSVPLSHPVKEPLLIEVAVGCENGPPAYLTLQQTKENLEKLLQAAAKAVAHPHVLAMRVFGLAEMP